MSRISNEMDCEALKRGAFVYVNRCDYRLRGGVSIRNPSR